jgi:hypothetical protein
MIRFRQRNMWWLAIMGLLVGLAVLFGSPLSPLIPVLLIGMLGAAAAASFMRLRPSSSALRDAAQRVPAAAGGGRQSAPAREAVSRAMTRGYEPSAELALMDLGLIAVSRGEDGMEMRRTRSISKDDEGVRPFLVLNVAPSEADRSVKLRFEMIDQNGRELYIHEMNCYLRDGEVNILPDHHLPLMNNGQVEGAGDWDLRVYLDHQLVAIHNFALTPSDDERARRLGGNARPRRYIMEEGESVRQGAGSRRLEDRADPEADIPLTLEDLLRDQKNQRSAGGGSR